MPAKVAVTLMFPSHDKEVTVVKKIPLDAWYKDDKAEIDVPLHPGMSTTSGKVELKPDTIKLIGRDMAGADLTGERIYIDGERGYQVKYRGLKGWVGPDGRYNYAAKIKRDAQDLQAGRDEHKVHPLTIWFGIALLISIVGNLILAGMAAGG